MTILNSRMTKLILFFLVLAGPLESVFGDNIPVTTSTNAPFGGAPAGAYGNGTEMNTGMTGGGFQTMPGSNMSFNGGKFGNNPLIASTCPFKEGLENLQTLEQNATRLINQIRSCDPSLTNNLQSILNNEMPPVTTNSSMVDCTNYQAYYSNLYQSALLDTNNQSNQYVSTCYTQLSSTTTMVSGVPYTTYGTPTQNQLSSCVQQQYNNSLVSERNTCSTNQDLVKQNSQQAAYRNYINSITSIAQQAIKDPKCTADNDVLKSSMSTLISVAAASPALGIAGAGLAAIGETLNALVTQPSSAKALKKLENETFNDDINCLFFYSFKQANQCVDKLLPPLPSPCVGEVSQPIQSKLKSIAEIAAAINENSSDKNALKGILDANQDFLNEQIKSLCNATPCKAKDLTSLPSDFTDISKPNKRDLAAAINRIQQMLDTKDEDSFQASLNDTKSLNVLMKAALEKNFYDQKSAYDELLGLEEIKEAMAGNSQMGGFSPQPKSQSTSLNGQVNQEARANTIYDSTNAVFGENIQNRLNDLFEKYKSNEQSYSKMNDSSLGDVDNKQKFSDLAKILQLCSLNSGAFLQSSNGSGNASLTFNSNKDFQGKCAPLLQCLGEKVPAKRSDPNENQKQLCILAKDYNQMLRNLSGLKSSEITTDYSGLKCQKK